MKIAMFVFGALEYSVALANALSKYCQVDFYCSKYLAKKKDLSILDPLGDKTNEFIIDDYRISNFRNLFIYYKICREIKNNNYDLIHLQGEGIPWLFFYRKMWKMIPVIYTVHDPYQHPGLPFVNTCYQDIMQKMFVRLARKIIVHGMVLKNQFLERYAEKNYKDVVVIPHGDFSIYRFWDNGKNDRTSDNEIKKILFFGSIRPNKGLEYLIKAEPLIGEKVKNYRIVIAGKCTDCAYKKYIKNSSKFTLVNEFIPNKDIPKYFKDASIVVLPYISATQSGIIPIAYAFGKPIIATNVGSIPEVVEDGKTGILVEPRDESALANAIIKLLSDDNLLKEMGDNALRYCKLNLSWDSIAQKTIKIYDEVIQKKTMKKHSSSNKL